MTTTYLLGAGASKEAGVPLAVEMAKLVFDTSRDEPREALTVAFAGLQQSKSLRFRPFEAIEIEELYETLLLLANRSNNLLAPFVASWSLAVDRVDSPKPWTAASAFSEHLAELLTTGPHSQERRSEIRQKLDAQVAQIIPRTGMNSVFKLGHEFVLKEILRMTKLTVDSPVDYLAPLLVERSEPTWIATLNYDNSVELAARKRNVHIKVDLRDIKPAGTPGAVTLVKLHGSVEWYIGRDDESQFDSPELPLQGSSPGVIFGVANKLKVEGPYLDLLLAFRDRLSITDELHVCGYSFRDFHINHLILNWALQPNRKMIVHDPAFTPEAKIRGVLAPHLRTRRPTVGKLHNITECDGKGAGEWLASL